MKLKSKYINGNIKDIITDQLNNTWIASFSGLLQFHNNKFINVYTHNPNDISSVSNNTINDLELHNTNQLWMATNDGLDVMNLKNSSISHLNKNNGLPSRIITSLLFEKNNTLWASTKNGLTRINTMNNKIITYNKNQGLQSDSFTIGALIKTQNNMIVAGGKGGFNIFSPEKLITPNTPMIQISDIKLFGKSINLNKLQSEHDILSNKTSITLSHEQNDIAITFSALDYNSPMDNKYELMLEGFHKSWIKRDAKNRVASFTNLDHGNYILKVKASNIYNVWSEPYDLLTIHVLPPWWLTPWAYIQSIFVTLIIFSLIYKIQTRRMRLRAMELETQVIERTDQINKQKSVIEHLLNKKTKCSPTSPTNSAPH